MPGVIKFIESDSGVVFARGLWVGEMGPCCLMGVSVLQDEKVLEVAGGDGRTAT